MLPESDLPPNEAAAARAVADNAATTSEPWLTRLAPRELAARLNQFGFREVIHLSPAEASARYFAGRSDGLQAPMVAQLMSATN